MLVKVIKLSVSMVNRLGRVVGNNTIEVERDSQLAGISVARNRSGQNLTCGVSSQYSLLDIDLVCR